jgi:catechol 2,3-dioxygenase-like lactoylglutathione lyase family enzyme
MIKTYGLTHIALAVSNLKKTLQFYKELFGVVPMYEEETWAQVQTPGAHDIIVFEENPSIAGKKSGGIQHFGFRLVEAVDIHKIRELLKNSNTEITDSGEFVPGEPYIFFRDPDVMKSKSGMKNPLATHFYDVDKLVNNKLIRMMLEIWK